MQSGPSGFAVAWLADEVIWMELGLSVMAILEKVTGLLEPFNCSIVYFGGWKMEDILLEDQAFMALMKIC